MASPISTNLTEKLLSIMVNDKLPSCSLSELLAQVRLVLADSFADSYWVRAETSDVRVNASSGHCYLEFVEKNSSTNQLIAKARGSIWAKTFRMLKPYFEMETGQLFTSGLKVLVRVQVEFHELYGFSLNVLDIDPAYTVGDMVKKRQEIIRQLKAEGIFTLNKELPLAPLLQRIAIITSPTAAGYEDFLHQLRENRGGFPFYTHLFPALMQGDRTEESIIAALERIDQHRELFDAVVIIRGGGATSDLHSFDSYLLASHCAQFPVPILTGIGHERDDTIVDLVAHTRLKTPTAVAEFLIACMEREAVRVDELQQTFVSDTRRILTTQKSLLQTLAARLPAAALNRIGRERSSLHVMAGKLPLQASQLLLQRRNELDLCRQRMRVAIESRLAKEMRALELHAQFVCLASPDYILKRGYTLTLQGGHIVKSKAELLPGNPLTTRFTDGEVESTIHLKND